MTSTGVARRWLGPPLALQIMGLLLAGLVVAQGATLVLTLLLPPAPRSQWDLGDIAGVLAGSEPHGRHAQLLQRTLQAAPPEARGPGWLLSDTARRDLAQLLNRPAEEVRLYFYTPLPFAGTGTTPPNARASARGTPDMAFAHADTMVAGLPEPAFLRVQAGGGMGMGGAGGMGGNRGGGPGFPETGFSRSPAPDNGMSPTRPGTGTASADLPASGPPTSSARQAPAGTDSAGTAPLSAATAPAPSRTAAGVDSPGPSSGPPAGAASPQPGAPAPPRPGDTASPPRLVPPASGRSDTAPRAMQPRSVDAAPAVAEKTAPAAPVRPGRTASSTAQPPAAARAPTVERTAPALAAGTPSAAATPPPSGNAPAPLVEARPAARGLFGLAPAPFVEGDFIAAMHTSEGSWVVVQPIPESFPNAWQRRVLLWFAIAAAVVLPAGWLFSRRLVRPISGFARAAERLGRDPSSAVLALEGPAEIGRAAQAFNRMQARLRSFVDDRTVMIGAISHDLRTPLTRMRFRIEDLPDEVRTGMLQDVEEMEQMIGAVLAFIRDASTQGTREQMDLASLVDDVVEQAVFVGKNVRLVHADSAPVDVDTIGMRRVLDNLIENAVKYGTQARVRLFGSGDCAVVEISDRGPGIADDELERVFQPFYRAPGARASGVPGSGLGLAVCRSIARAHGGDVVLKPGAHGLVAQLRVPLSTRTGAFA